MYRPHSWLALIAITAACSLVSAAQAQNRFSVSWKPTANSAQLKDRRAKAERYSDLVVKLFRASRIYTDSDGNFKTHIYFELKNQGVSTAWGRMYSTVYFSAAGGKEQVAKRISHSGVQPGKEARIASAINLPRYLMGQTVYLWLIADSADKNFESNENNNHSQRIAVRLPMILGSGNQVLKLQSGR